MRKGAEGVEVRGVLTYGPRMMAHSAADYIFKGTTESAHHSEKPISFDKTKGEMDAVFSVILVTVPSPVTCLRRASVAVRDRQLLVRLERAHDEHGAQ